MLTAAVLSGCGQPKGDLYDVPGRRIVWPSGPAPARIALVGSLRGSGDLRAEVTGAEQFAEIIRGPRGSIDFRRPHGVAIVDGQWLAVTDTGLGAVHIIDLVGRTHRLVSGWAGQRFDVPLGAAWVGERLFVVDAGRHEVIELDKMGGMRRSIGTDVLKRPVGCAVDAAQGRLYVVDGDAADIAVFDLTGQLLSRMGGPGVGPVQFNHPTHVAVGPSGRLAVADSGNFRVQLLSSGGEPVAAFGVKGDAAGNFALPKGVAFDSDGHIYVVDAHFENIQIFDQEGRLLLPFGDEGAKHGQFALPAGIAIDNNDRIWVADSANQRIQIFDYLKVEP